MAENIKIEWTVCQRCWCRPCQCDRLLDGRTWDQMPGGGVMRVLIAALLLASPATAEVWTGGTRMTLQPGHGDCFAVVEVRNLVGTYNQIETLDTAHGPVSVRYTTVGGHRPGDDDLIDVASLPSNVLAVPLHMALPDGETGRICLRLWEGM